MRRRHLLSHYNIPYTVLVNHEESPLEDEKVPTLVPMHEDEILYNGNGYNPYMAQKFLSAVKMLFRSYRNYDDIPTYIVRINATVYIHYPSLLKVLNDDKFPKERVLAGLNWGNVFVQGMVMVFSKDVLVNMIQDPRIYSKDIMKHNDDVSLSVLADPYSQWIDWNIHSCWYYRICSQDDNEKYRLEEIKPEKNDIWIFRIWDPHTDRKMDVINWDLLLKHFNEYEIVHQHPTTTFEPIITSIPDENDVSSSWWYVGAFIILCVFVFFAIVVKDKKKKIELGYNKLKKMFRKFSK